MNTLTPNQTEHLNVLQTELMRGAKTLVEECAEGDGVFLHAEEVAGLALWFEALAMRAHCIDANLGRTAHALAVPQFPRQANNVHPFPGPGHDGGSAA